MFIHLYLIIALFFKNVYDLTLNFVASLEHDLTKCVIIVDFTKWGLVVDGNVHCFVVCVLFRDKNEKKQSKDEYRGIVICFIYLNAYFYDAGWKPAIKYFDFFAQSTKENKVKQVFPFVKV